MQEEEWPTGLVASTIPATMRRWPWVRLIVGVVRGFRRNHLDARSAQLAYYAMLGIAPLLILIIAAFSQLPVGERLDRLVDIVGAAIPPDAQRVLVDQIHDIEKHSTPQLVLVGLVTLAYAGIRFFRTIARGLNAAYGIPEERRFVRFYGVALLFTVAAYLLILLALVVAVVGPAVLSRIMEGLGVPALDGFWNHAGRWTAACLAVLLALSVIYWLAPSEKLRWRLLSPGSVFATLGWALASLGFRFYVANFSRYNETYGALGGVIVLMVWLYLVGAVLFAGGQLNSVWEQGVPCVHRRQMRQSAHPPSV